MSDRRDNQRYQFLLTKTYSMRSRKQSHSLDFCYGKGGILLSLWSMSAKGKRERSTRLTSQGKAGNILSLVFSRAWLQIVYTCQHFDSSLSLSLEQAF